MQNLFYPSFKARWIDRDQIIQSIKEEAIKVAAQDTRIQQVFLFGSCARRDNTPRSDADLLIIVKQDTRRPLDRIPEYLIAFSNLPVPVDVLVYTEDEVSQAQASGNPFIREAMKGIALLAA